MGGKRWSDDEIATMKQIAESGETLLSQMHRLPGRTWAAARLYASKEGIAFKESVSWSADEQARLRKIYSSNESIKLGVRRLLPHRSYLAAKGEAQRLGLSGTKTRTGRTGYSWIERAIEDVLANGGRMTVKQLATRTGGSINAIGKVLAKNRGTKFRVADWERVGGAAVWELGSGPDAPRRPPRTAADACRAFRERSRIRAGRVDPFASLIQQVTA
ncbi:hypothetical protein DIE15_12315 [Burkholderia sp. Bp9031]|uniref:hypothetical protein n=1 Tax=Burkholderia sp. Bp9031 TaxID=2184566 RepID=UPI000F5DEDFE|nr:hypothetical protein [Burkholderia sp. Bp9031]RQZ17251.1 hypothetical protein DIE15_12315 [Burkholderia sp. Bp9031]